MITLWKYPTPFAENIIRISHDLASSRDKIPNKQRTNSHPTDVFSSVSISDFRWFGRHLSSVPFSRSNKYISSRAGVILLQDPMCLRALMTPFTNCRPIRVARFPRLFGRLTHDDRWTCVRCALPLTAGHMSLQSLESSKAVDSISCMHTMHTACEMQIVFDTFVVKKKRLYRPL